LTKNKKELKGEE